jgi:EpsI family protein
MSEIANMPEDRIDPPQSEPIKPPSCSPGLSALLWRSALLFVLVAATIVAGLLGPKVESGSLPGVKMELPYKIGQYWGYDQEVSEAELAILPKDTGFARKKYDTLDGDEVFCSIVLAGAQRQSIHRPEVCLPAQGWSIRDRSTERVKLANGKEIPITVLTLVRPVQLPNGQTVEIRQLYAYWFVGRTRMTHSHYSRIFESMLDRILYGINHRWAYVTVSSIISETIKRDGKTKVETLNMLKEFIAQSAPQFIKDEAFGFATKTEDTGHQSREGRT